MFEKINPVVQTLRRSLPRGRLPRRKRASLGRPDVLDPLRKRLEHWPEYRTVHRREGEFFISQKKM
jgi:hypothetical protein